MYNFSYRKISNEIKYENNSYLLQVLHDFAFLSSFLHMLGVSTAYFYRIKSPLTHDIEIPSSIGYNTARRGVTSHQTGKKFLKSVSFKSIFISFLC